MLTPFKVEHCTESEMYRIHYYSPAIEENTFIDMDSDTTLEEVQEAIRLNEILFGQDEEPYSLPDLTLETIFNEYINPDIYSPSEVWEILDDNGYKSIGWLNDGVQPPKSNDFKDVYRTRSGSTTIVVSPSLKVYYNVDMGD